MNHSHQKAIIAFFAGLLSLTLAAQSTPDKIAPAVWQASSGAAGAEVEGIILFKADADLSDLPGIHGKVRKGRMVYERLRATAEESQRQVRNMLRRANRPFRAFAVVNAIHTKMDRSLLMRLADRPEVEYIQANPWGNMLQWMPEREQPVNGRSPIDWGLTQINVPQVWEQGITGSGVVIGNHDTGVEWTHPALKEKYRGWQGSDTEIDHQYHWFDAITMISPLHDDEQIDPANNPCGLSVDFPCDDNDHGTYTTGISVGDDGLGNQIGVAPGARWIACRNMERGYGSPATYLAGFEWFLAPTDLEGNNPRPELAPHVINNSWGCPVKEGCTAENWGILEKAVENLRSAGIVVVVSAGNEGPACSSVDDPSAIFAGSFAVGATDITDTLAGFSSRGPVTVDASGILKPDVVAPGVQIRSARRNDDFLVGSGTSAAGPFVAGVVALMIEANPDLAGEVELIEQLLRETAVPAFDTISCGGYTDRDIPNPMTGYGRIDALVAVARARQVSPVEELNSEPQVRVYPNPTRNRVQLAADPDLIGGTTVELYNSVGALIRREQVTDRPVTIDLGREPAGIYWWRWKLNGLYRSGRILKF